MVGPTGDVSGISIVQIILTIWTIVGGILLLLADAAGSALTPDASLGAGIVVWTIGIPIAGWAVLGLTHLVKEKPWHE